MSAASFETLNEYEQLANQLLVLADPRAIAHAARILALYVGHYQLRYGPIASDALDSINSTSPTAQQVADRVEAMRILAAAIAVAALSLPAADDGPN